MVHPDRNLVGVVRSRVRENKGLFVNAGVDLTLDILLVINLGDGAAVNGGWAERTHHCGLRQGPTAAATGPYQEDQHSVQVLSENVYEPPTHID